MTGPPSTANAGRIIGIVDTVLLAVGLVVLLVALAFVLAFQGG